MVSDATLKARIARILYQQGAYLPDWVAVADIEARILPAEWQGRVDAQSAIERTALDSASPVVYKPGTGRSALSLERGSRADVDARVKDWIERHDPSELPFGLQ
jgi:hypothetical protein